MVSSVKLTLVFVGVLVFAGLLVGAYRLGESKNCSNAASNPGKITLDTNGPYYHKIYKATSEDGLTWQKDEEVIFDHASVPGAIIRDGIIYLYFVDASSSSDAQLSVAISKDLGKSFQKQTTKVNGANLPPVDPDPVLLDNGKIRLYYFANPIGSGDPATAEGSHQIMAAESSDGINFENPEQVFAEQSITDPDVFKTAKDWRLFASTGAGMDLAISSDGGVTFQKQADFSWNNGGVSTTNDINGILRTYYCGQGGIDSAIGAENGKLTAESGIRIEVKGKMSCDPTVIKMPDGSFMMFYKVMENSKK